MRSTWQLLTAQGKGEFGTGKSQHLSVPWQCLSGKFWQQRFETEKAHAGMDKKLFRKVKGDNVKWEVNLH